MMDELINVRHLQEASQQTNALIASVVQAAADDISAVNARLDALIKLLSANPSRDEVEVLVSQAIAAHDSSEESHPTHLSIR